MPKHLLSRLTWVEARQAAAERRVIILPVGTLENQRATAFTILFISTGSNEPLRLRTRIVVCVVSSLWRAAVAEVCKVKVSIYQNPLWGKLFKRPAKKRAFEKSSSKN